MLYIIKAQNNTESSISVLSAVAVGGRHATKEASTFACSLLAVVYHDFQNVSHASANTCRKQIFK